MLLSPWCPLLQGTVWALAVFPCCLPLKFPGPGRSYQISLYILKHVRSMSLWWVGPPLAYLSIDDTCTCAEYLQRTVGRCSTSSSRMCSTCSSVPCLKRLPKDVYQHVYAHTHIYIYMQCYRRPWERLRQPLVGCLSVWSSQQTYVLHQHTAGQRELPKGSKLHHRTSNNIWMRG